MSFVCQRPTAPKTSTNSNHRCCAWKTHPAVLRGETKLIAAIESASGVVNALAIATASPRMTAVALAGFDYLV